LTLGKNGGTAFFLAILFQFVDLKKGWLFNSFIPFEPSLYSGFLHNNPLSNDLHSAEKKLFI